MRPLCGGPVFVAGSQAATESGAPSMGLMEMLSDPTRVGLMALIAVGAIVAGKMVHNVWPKHQNPTFWGAAVALLIVGALAYLGIPEAAVVLWAFLAVAAVLGLMALVL